MTPPESCYSLRRITIGLTVTTLIACLCTYGWLYLKTRSTERALLRKWRPSSSLQVLDCLDEVLQTDSVSVQNRWRKFPGMFKGSSLGLVCQGARVKMTTMANAWEKHAKDAERDERVAAKAAKANNGDLIVVLDQVAAA